MEIVKIKELETQVVMLLKEKKKDEEFRLDILKLFEELKPKTKVKVVKHLSSVHVEHLSSLKGFRMKYNVPGDGRCLENCAAVHTCGDEQEGKNIREMINNHVADNWEGYWKAKIGLPFKDIVIVDGVEKVYEKKTDEEMIKFLKSDRAMKAYSTGHELLAIANLFNIKIHIFTYKGKEGRWNEVVPDALVTSSESAGNWASDMYLYHSENNHYDLLVSDDSRLAQMDLHSDGEKEPYRHSEEWQTVKPRKKNSKQNSIDEEKLLTDDISMENADNKDLGEMEEELTLSKSKNSGHQRTAPQAPAESKETTNLVFKCDQCANELESQGLLDAHMNNHIKTKFTCKKCDEVFDKSLDLEMHKIEEHEVKEKLEEWNCNDCSYQTNTISDLMKHLQISGHQPSESIQEKRKVFQDYKQCYTCRLEFNGKWSLMNHRKNDHPSNKKCRNFPSGKCVFGSDCWYVHEEELMDVDESFKAESTPKASLFKCYLCTTDFMSKDSFMKHKKQMHPKSVQSCVMAGSERCKKTDEECWFHHHQDREQSSQTHSSRKEQVFQEAPGNQFPPDQMTKLMEMMNNLFSKVETMEKRLKEGII